MVGMLRSGLGTPDPLQGSRDASDEPRKEAAATYHRVAHVLYVVSNQKLRNSILLPSINLIFDKKGYYNFQGGWPPFMYNT